MWNFGTDPREPETQPAAPKTSVDSDEFLSPPINGRLSAGIEVYYGLLNKGGGRRLRYDYN